jgi:probable HAF family extracellular repeat protein
MTTYTFSIVDDPTGTLVSEPLGINDLGQVVGDYADSFGVHGFLYSGGTYTTLAVPGATNGTWAYDINNLGQIVGLYKDSNSAEHGFLYSSSTFSYTPLNDPLGISTTQAHGINDFGMVVGQYTDNNGDHGFLYNSGTYTTLNDPSGTEGTQAYGINDAGQIVGNYFDSSGTEHGFLYSGGTYTTLNAPGATNGTEALGINDAGQIAGYYVGSSSAVHGFLYSGGTYTTFDVSPGFSLLAGINNAGQLVGNYADSSPEHGFLATPPTATTYTFSTLNAPSGTDGTVAQGINDLGQIVGFYRESILTGHGFLYSGGIYTTSDVVTNGTPVDINDLGQIVGGYTDSNSTEHGFLFTTIAHTVVTITLDPSGSNGTQANGINDAGQVVGYYTDSNGMDHGFLYNSGIYTPLNDPLGTGGTQANGINDAGQIVGYYVDSSGANHGFLYSGGTYTTLDDPLGAKGTFAQGINDLGQIVGFYRDSSSAVHGFLYSGGTFTTLDDPLGTISTDPEHINDAGQIAGFYLDSSDAQHGFLANPSSPTTTPATSVQQEVLGLYAALYNRAADFPGYSFWVGVDGQQPDSGGVTVANASATAITLNDAGVLGQAFVNTQATFFNQTYASLTDSQFINALYVNIGGNAGDPGGVAYWANLLAQAEAGGQSVQAARAGLVGQFVHDLIGFDTSIRPAGLTDAQWQDALTREAAINDKIAVSLAYSNASQQTGGSILDAHSVGDAAYNAAVAVIQGVTSYPDTVLAAITGINNAVAHQDLSLI